MSVLGVSADQLLFAPIGLLAFVVLLTIIVFFHEYGHFSVARLLGVRVDVFSIGFGKALARWTDRHGTEWRIAMLPFGGYVKFFGDAGPASDAGEAVADADEPAAEDGDPKDARASTRFPRADEAGAGGRGLTPEEKAVCFHFKPLWRRAAIVAAGPMANFLLAFVIFWGLLIVLGQGYWQARVGSVAPDSAAEAAGILAGDRIVAIDGRKIESCEDRKNGVLIWAGAERTLRKEHEGPPGEIEKNPPPQQ
ncbi:MAG: site-2 protease family protein, partial [Pseudomonadota bacterium]